MDLAVGVAPHTGWAIAVVVGGTASAPAVVHRERVRLCPDDLPRQVFHAAAGMPIDQAAALVAEVDAAVTRTTGIAVAHLVERAAPHGRVVGMGLLGTPREMPELERALASHALLHASEGELYRGALDDAAQEAGLPVHALASKHAIDDAAAALGTTGQLLGDRLTTLRTELGAPWQADHRAATAAALVALAG